MEENLKYERQVSLKTIYLTLIRRTEMILIIFIPLFLASFIVTKFVLPKQYTSSAVVSNNAALSSDAYSRIQLYAETNGIYTSVAQNLANNGVKHSNGGAITVSEISSGIGFSTYSSNMSYFTITFASEDSTITKAALNSYTTVALTALKDSYPNLSVTESAGDPVKTSKENQYFLIATVASLVLALGIPFIYEIVTDEVFDKEDIELYGVPAFEIKAGGK